MEVYSIREFKSSFKRIVLEKEKVLVTRRGKPIGIFSPVAEEDLKKARKMIAHTLVGLGKGEKGKVSEEHDEVIYG